MRHLTKRPGRYAHINGLILTVYAFLLLAVNGCGWYAMVRGLNAEREFQEVMDAINNDPDYIYQLKDKRVGETGYFYIIDFDGIVVYHPQKSLIGVSFRSIPFVQAVLKRGEGCIRQSVENRPRVILFRLLRRRWILCMSIGVHELDIHGLNCTDAGGSMEGR